jgi:hypothetical protein
MFLYQNRLLKAETTNGILETQTLMVNLYAANLNAVGVQAALICQVTYIGINNAYIQTEIKQGFLCLIYQVCYAVSMSAALIMVSHTILASMLGPTKSLIGKKFKLIV